jgi:hypothetical protein
MKNYELDSIFSFGKHHGEILSKVFINDPSYVDWCIKKLNHFSIEEDVFDKLLLINPKYQFSRETLAILKQSWDYDAEDLANMYEAINERDCEPHDYDQNADWERDCFDAMTDGQYGSYDDFKDNCGDYDNLIEGLGH